MILNIPGVIHLFVTLLGTILGVLLGILVSPQTLMEILIGGVSEPLNLFPHTFDFTGHKMAKTRILFKWLTKLTHLCCVLSLF